MMHTVNMPEQLPEADTPTVISVFKRVGDSVQVGEILFSYCSDGARLEERSCVAGAIKAVIFAENDAVSGGTPIIVIEERDL